MHRFTPVLRCSRSCAASARRFFGADAAGTNGRYGTTDNNMALNQLPPGGAADKRAFTYFVLGGAKMLYANAARLALISVVGSLSASKDVLAMSSVEVDMNSIGMGQTVTIKWRGKPVFIKHRTAEQIADVQGPAPAGEFRHPQTDAERAPNPEWLVVMGVCTHLGCVPIPNAGDFNGWYCPCHGSHYDGSGRIRRGPAPLNLEIPEYKFLPGDKMLLG